MQKSSSVGEQSPFRRRPHLDLARAGGALLLSPTLARHVCHGRQLSRTARLAHLGPVARLHCRLPRRVSRPSSSSSSSRSSLHRPGADSCSLAHRWCGPCKAIAPVYQRLASQFAGRVQCLKVDVDQVPAVAQRFSVSAMPTFVVLKGSNKVDEVRPPSSLDRSPRCLRADGPDLSSR